MKGCLVEVEGAWMPGGDAGKNLNDKVGVSFECDEPRDSTLSEHECLTS